MSRAYRQIGDKWVIFNPKKATDNEVLDKVDPAMMTDVRFKLLDSTKVDDRTRAIVEDAMRSILSRVVSTAKANLAANNSVRTGLLKKAIRLKVSGAYKGFDEGTRKYSLFAGVGIDRKVVGYDEHGKRIAPAKYAHLVEYGHLTNTGVVVPPKSFLRRAIAAVGGVDAINKKLTESFKRGLQEAINADGY